MKKVYWLPIVVAIFTLGFLYLLLKDNSQKQNFHPLLEKKAPQITLSTLKGKTLPYAYFEGKPTLLIFFSTWCPSCMMMKPSLYGLPCRILGVLYRDKGFMADASPFDVSLFDEIVLDNEGTEGAAFGIKGVPELFLIDKTGTIKWHHRGAISKEKLDKELSSFF